MWGFIFGTKGWVARVGTVAPKNITKSRTGLAAHYMLGLLSADLYIRIPTQEDVCIRSQSVILDLNNEYLCLNDNLGLWPPCLLIKPIARKRPGSSSDLKPTE